MSTLEPSKIVMYDFWFHYVQSKYGEKVKGVLYGYRQFHCMHKNMIFIKTLQKMLKQCLILQVMNQIDHWLKNKK